MIRSVVTGLILMLAFCLPGSQAQSTAEGYLSVIQDSQVDTVLLAYRTARTRLLENPDSKAIPGFRIQVFFDSGSNSSDRARSVKEGFNLLFPDIPAYVSWKAPNYRVRVGDFRTRLEAEKALQIITIDYPNAWVIKDEINFPVIN
jgi:hypothetical protein